MTTSRTPRSSSGPGWARSSAAPRPHWPPCRSRRRTSTRCASWRRTPRRPWPPSAPAPAEADAKIASAEQSLTGLARQVRRQRPDAGVGQHPPGQGTAGLRAERLRHGPGEARRRRGQPRRRRRPRRRGKPAPDQRAARSHHQGGRPAWTRPATASKSAVVDTSQDLAQARAMIQSGAHPELAGPVAGGGGRAGPGQGRNPGRQDRPHRHAGAGGNRPPVPGPALTGIRDQQEQARRAQASLQQSIMSAQAQISATSDYITARRGGVGTEARTRLAEAQRNLDYALSISRTDPVTALHTPSRRTPSPPRPPSWPRPTSTSSAATPTRATAAAACSAAAAEAAASAAPSSAAS